MSKDKIYVEDVINIVRIVTGISEENLIGKKSIRTYVDARRICYKLIMQYVHTTISFLQRRFNRSAHGTILSAMKVHDNLMTTDPEYSLKYNLCKDFLLNKDEKYELIHKDAAVIYYKDRVKVLEEENRRLRNSMGLTLIKRK